MSNNNTKKVVKSNKTVTKEKSHIGFLLFAVVLFVVVLISTVFKDWMQIMENNRLTKDYEAYYVELQEEEASLNNEVVKLQNPDYLARMAREKYGYTKDGENILTIIDSKVVSKNSEKE